MHKSEEEKQTETTNVFVRPTDRTLCHRDKLVHVYGCSIFHCSGGSFFFHSFGCIVLMQAKATSNFGLPVNWFSCHFCVAQSHCYFSFSNVIANRRHAPLLFFHSLLSAQNTLQSYFLDFLAIAHRHLKFLTLSVRTWLSMPIVLVVCVYFVFERRETLSSSVNFVLNP